MSTLPQCRLSQTSDADSCSSFNKAQWFHTGLSNDFLISLADEIEHDKHADSLGRALGFSNRKLKDFQVTNYMSGRKTSKGTEDMLFEWRQMVSPNDQHGRMREALLKAGLRYLADLHFGTQPSM